MYDENDSYKRSYKEGMEIGIFMFLYQENIEMFDKMFKEEQYKNARNRIKWLSRFENKLLYRKLNKYTEYFSRGDSEFSEEEIKEYENVKAEVFELLR